MLNLQDGMTNLTWARLNDSQNHTICEGVLQLLDA